MTYKRIILVDYGMCNINSVKNAFEFLGCDCVVTNDIKVIANGDPIVLPGVGSFYRAMNNIRELNIEEVLLESVTAKGTPILGICLGMQLLAEIGDEGKQTKGLGLINGHVRRLELENGLKVPHVGFNTVSPTRGKFLFAGIPENFDAYFVHSYHLTSYNQEDIAGWSIYDKQFVAAVEHCNIFGTQFHPEKSQSNGLRVLESFLTSC